MTDHFVWILILEWVNRGSKRNRNRIRFSFYLRFDCSSKCWRMRRLRPELASLGIRTKERRKLCLVKATPFKWRWLEVREVAISIAGMQLEFRSPKLTEGWSAECLNKWVCFNLPTIHSVHLCSENTNEVFLRQHRLGLTHQFMFNSLIQNTLLHTP